MELKEVNTWIWLIDAQRGICFEVTYSALIADVQARRQLISTAKVTPASLCHFSIE